MQMPSLNDIKIRELQLKARGYDIQQTVQQYQASIQSLTAEYNALNGEIKKITELFAQIETQKSQSNLPLNNAPAGESKSENSSVDESTLDQGFITIKEPAVAVDNETAESLVSNSKPTKVVKSTPRVKKTAHEVGGSVENP